MHIVFKNINQFKEQIAKQGLSQSQLAKVAGVTQPYLNQTINGKRNPGLNFCEKICTALKMEFDDIFEFQSESESFEVAQEFHDFPFCFSPLVAKVVGLNESIFIQFLTDWQSNYKSIEKNYTGGHYWVPLDEKQLLDVFIFWDAQTVDKVIGNLISLNLVVRDENRYRVDFDKLSRVVNG